jgi:C_GCAxxG_C_C family probable redox protein
MPDMRGVQDRQATIERAANLAAEHFAHYNCAESAFWGVAIALNLPLTEALLCISTPFGAGIGQARATCGALSGAVMALGLVLGRSIPDPERKRTAYACARTLYESFVTEAGGDACRIINEPGFERPDLHTHCVRYVRLAARLAATILLDETKQLNHEGDH